jgi:hypothetical protein
MSTKKTRINITCEKEIMSLLAEMAKDQERSTAGFAKELILEALEMREDIALSKLAEIRDIATAGRIPHDIAWK